MSIHLDHAALAAVTSDLTAAATTFDGSGQGVPTPDAGLATVILGAMLHSFGEAGARLVDDGASLASVADACNVDLATTDSEAADELLESAP
ncbi:hypothetical protein [Nocardioides mangrovi]|uniref:ESX-1 secretion-associated protein n=1 Tax=Nocardioides mangrovi TaxID=2874580 RepID=A0ABS7UBT5_9ACTN|nr:hypothetical protein [Nocardioides mangrovi]MBZ5738299.1 hypothetical protein [Nocardioides mangrovi]